MNIGGFNRLMYDECASQQRIEDSTSPYNYMTYGGAYENCKKCTYENQFWRPFNNEIVDRESELLGLGRPATKCSKLKFSPNCGKPSPRCRSTYDKTNPVIFDRVCSIINSNIPVQKNPGYKMPSSNICKK
jgi:hypothetical protein